MLKKFLEQRLEKRTTFRRLLSDALVRKIEEEGEVVIDRSLTREFGASRKEVFRAACVLVMQEKMHLGTGEDDLLHIMSNYRFEQATRASASLYRTVRMDEAEIIEPLSVTDPESEAIFVDDMGLFTLKHTSGRHKEPIAVESAEFEVRDGRDGRGILPDGRKTLPPRDRDPWLEFDSVDYIPRNEPKKK